MHITLHTNPKGPAGPCTIPLLRTTLFFRRFEMTTGDLGNPVKPLEIKEILEYLDAKDAKVQINAIDTY